MAGRLGSSSQYTGFAEVECGGVTGIFDSSGIRVPRGHNAPPMGSFNRNAAL